MQNNDRGGSGGWPTDPQSGDLDSGRTSANPASASPISSRRPDGPDAQPNGSEPGRSSAAMRGTQGADYDYDKEPRAADSTPRSMPSKAKRADSGPTGAELTAARDTDETPQADDRAGGSDLVDPTSR